MAQKIDPGGTLTLRVPTNASEYVLNYLRDVRENEARGFAPKVFQLLERAILAEKKGGNQTKPHQPSLFPNNSVPTHPLPLVNRISTFLDLNNF